MTSLSPSIIILLSILISLRRQHMRKVLALGAAVLFISSVGVAGAQERLPQSSSGSGFGVGPEWETFQVTPVVLSRLRSERIY